MNNYVQRLVACSGLHIKTVSLSGIKRSYINCDSSPFGPGPVGTIENSPPFQRWAKRRSGEFILSGGLRKGLKSPLRTHGFRRERQRRGLWRPCPTNAAVPWVLAQAPDLHADAFARVATEKASTFRHSRESGNPGGRCGPDFQQGLQSFGTYSVPYGLIGGSEVFGTDRFGKGRRECQERLRNRCGVPRFPAKTAD